MGEGTSPADPLIGRDIGGCRVLSRIARGGMGVIYLAEQAALRRRVILKILPAEAARDREYVARFRREAVAAARLEHPNVIQVYDVGEHEGLPFMVRQYVEGMALSEILKDSGRLEPKEAARVAREVARGLAAAHAQGIVHRDVKPENILVSENGEVRIGDFGIALDPDATGTSSPQGLLVGTPHYLSPEQAEGRKSDARSDLYSLGVTLYAMVTGRVPFTGPTVAAVMYKHVREKPRKPSGIVRDLPPFLEGVILKLMQKAPEDRYRTAEEVEHDLDRFVRGVHPRGKRESAGAPAGTRRAAKSALSGPALYAVAGVAAAALIVLVVLLTRPGKTEPGGKLPDPAPPPRSQPDAGPPKDEAAFQEIEEAERTGKQDLFRQRAEAFLRNFPSSRRAPEIREKLARPAPPPEAETGFTTLYRSPSDGGFWAFSPGLERHVFFLADSILVSVPASGADTDEIEFLTANQPDIEEFILRFEIRSGTAFPSLCAGKLLRGEPSLADRIRTTTIDCPSLPIREWHALELEAKGGRLALRSGTRVLASGSIEAGGSPFGRPGFACRPGADFELRRVRIRVLRRADLAGIAREQTPPPDPDPAPPPPPREAPSRDEAEILEKMRETAPGEIPALALRLRDLVFSRPAREVFDGKSLGGWRIIGPAAGESVQPRDGRIEVEVKGKAAFMEHAEIPGSRGLSFEIRVRRFHAPTGAGLALHRRTPTHYATLVVLPGEAVLREQDGSRRVNLAQRDLPMTLDRWFRIDMLAAGGQTYLFLDNAFLWRGPSVEADALGPAALWAGDVDGDFRSIKVYPRP